MRHHRERVRERERERETETERERQRQRYKHKPEKAKSDDCQLTIFCWYNFISSIALLPNKPLNLATCKICSSEIPMKDFSSSNLLFHLKQNHRFLKKYNAWKIYEVLSGINEELP